MKNTAQITQMKKSRLLPTAQYNFTCTCARYQKDQGIKVSRIEKFPSSPLPTCFMFVRSSSCRGRLDIVHGILSRPGGMERAIAKFQGYFVERGLELKDVPAAIVIHEVIGLAFALSMWSACYALQPSRALLRPVVNNSAVRANTHARLQQAYTAAMAHATATMRRMSWLQRAPGLDPARLTVSLAESLCVRAAAKPVTFVAKLWASWKLLLVLKVVQGRGRPQAANAAPQATPLPQAPSEQQRMLPLQAGQRKQ